MDKNSNLTGYGVVLVTAGSQQEALAIAKTLVKSQLAACVNIVPLQSIYTWQGELHSYEVPEIIALPIVAGSQPYLNWISQNTTGK